MHEPFHHARSNRADFIPEAMMFSFPRLTALAVLTLDAATAQAHSGGHQAMQASDRLIHLVIAHTGPALAAFALALAVLFSALLWRRKPRASKENHKGERLQ
jgi:hypothetical protein